MGKKGKKKVTSKPNGNNVTSPGHPNESYAGAISKHPTGQQQQNGIVIPKDVTCQITATSKPNGNNWSSPGNANISYAGAISKHPTGQQQNGIVTPKDCTSQITATSIHNGNIGSSPGNVNTSYAGAISKHPTGQHQQNGIVTPKYVPRKITASVHSGNDGSSPGNANTSYAGAISKHPTGQQQQNRIVQPKDVQRQMTATSKHIRNDETDLGKANTSYAVTKSKHPAGQQQQNSKDHPKDHQSQITGALVPIAKKDFGTIGKPIKLFANYFLVSFKNPDLDIYHYDVKISEWTNGYTTEQKAHKRQIFNSMIMNLPKEYQCMGFDNEMSAYTAKSLPPGLLNEINNLPHDVKHDNGRKKTYKVILELVNHGNLKTLFDAMNSGNSIINTSTTSVLQMLEVMLRHTNFKHHKMVGLNSFLPLKDIYSETKHINAKLTKRCVLGFFASLRPAVWKEVPKLLLKFDVSHRAFYSHQDVFMFMKRELSISNVAIDFKLEEGNLRKFRELIKNVKIKTKYNGFNATVVDVKEFSANEKLMSWWTEERIFDKKEPDLEIINRRKREVKGNFIEEVELEGTVAEYLFYKYSVKLEYECLNCLQLHPETMKKYVPIELCEIPDGVIVKKGLTDTEKRNFLVASGGSSNVMNERLRKSKNILKMQDYNNLSPTVTSLHMEIEDEPVMTDGRVLPPLVLKMGDCDIEPYEGEWDPRNHKFFYPNALTSWAVCNYSRLVKETVMEFVTKLIQNGKDRGCRMHPPIYMEKFKHNQSEHNPRADFLQLRSEKKDIKLILVVMPKEKIKGEIYDKVKIAGDREVKILTAGVQEANIKKLSLATIGNVLLKINAKLGGVCTVLKGNEELFAMHKENHVMFVGIDVNHPPPDDTSTPSLAAVVGSMDQYVSKYALELRHQRHRTEMVKDLQDMIRKLLLTFYHHEHLSRKPQRIIVYRDGVSESEFEKVLCSELKAIRDACTSLSEDYKPSVTFIVLQKTTHTRLYCQKEEDGVGKAKNIPPGTVVDRDITSPWYTEFYLAAHKSDFGTSKPGRYCVLWDDNNLSMDNLQSMTFAICHLYQSCTKAVSQPAPTYYAHHAAARAKLYIKHLCKDDGQLPPDQEIAKAINFGSEHPLHKTLFYL